MALIVLPPNQWHRVRSSLPSPARPLAKARQAESSQRQRRNQTEGLSNVSNISNHSSGSSSHNRNGNVLTPANRQASDASIGSPSIGSSSIGSPSTIEAKHSRGGGRHAFSASRQGQGQMARGSSPSNINGGNGANGSPAPSRTAALRFRTDSAHTLAGAAGPAADSIGSQGSSSSQPLHQRYVDTSRTFSYVRTGKSRNTVNQSSRAHAFRIRAHFCCRLSESYP